MKAKSLVALLLILLFALVSAAAGYDWLRHALQIINGWFEALHSPTDGWTKLIGSLVWPLVLLYFLSRYRGHVTRVLDTIADRLRRDNVKVGPFELTTNSEVIALSPGATGESTENFLPEDLQRIEEFFEFISEEANFRQLAAWMAGNMDPRVSLDSFLTEYQYAMQREQAYQALMGQGGAR